MRFISRILAITQKDVVIEFRTRETLSGMLIFSVLVILIFNFAFELRVDNVREVVPGALWVTFTFAGVLALNRSFASERDQGSLEGLLLAPMDRSAIYFGKTLANVLFMLLIESIILPVASVFFNLNLLQLQLLVVVFLGTIGFAGVGTLLSAVAINTRARDVMLPILLFPISIPMVVAAVKLSAAIIDTGSMAEAGVWWPILLSFDAIFLTVSALIFEYAVEY